MPYIKILKNGKPQIIKSIALCTFLDGKLPLDTAPIDELFSYFNKLVGKREGSVSKDAMNNVHGDWYEWLLAIAAWNYSAENANANIALLTPNVSQFDVAQLYNSKLYNLIKDLRQKVLNSSSVQLISSNPDFVIIDRKLVNATIKDIKPISILNTDKISFIENIFREFSGKCDFNDILGYISVKTSFRPDRRLQIPHEGSLMKAIYTHLQTREWIINPQGIKYYAMATKVGVPDRAALKTVATHSITTVHSIPQAAVDEVFEVNTLQQAQFAFSQILSS